MNLDGSNRKEAAEPGETGVESTPAARGGEGREPVPLSPGLSHLPSRVISRDLPAWAF